MAEHAADRAFEIAHAGLARVIGDDRMHGGVAEVALLGVEAIRFELTLDQIAPRDLGFLGFRVAGKLDHFHPIAQRTRNRIEHVCRADEHHLRQIEWHREIVIAKGRVLLRIEHFEQRRGRIALNAVTELVDLVQHHHAIARAGAAHALNDVAGQRADVRAAVATDFRFIVNAAQADADKLATGRFGDALAERRLADAGRTDKAQDRTLALRVQLAHREIFEDAPLHLVETEVVIIQNVASACDVDMVVGRLRPRHFGQPFEIRAEHWILARALLHPLEALQLFARMLIDFCRHLRFVDRLRQIGDLAAGFAAVAQLLVDRLQLLAQQQVALRFRQALLCLIADLARQPQHFDPADEMREHGVETLL